MQSTGTRLTPALDWTDAYYGGTCLQVSGNLGAPNDLKLYAYLLDRAMELLDAAGATRRWAYPLERVFPEVHLLGTCRMGNDPATSVVDRFNRTHDIHNLFLVDGSSLVTSGRGQPTMTIQALAFRAAEHAASLARRGELSKRS